MVAGLIKLLREQIPAAKITLWHAESPKRKMPTTSEMGVEVVAEDSAHSYYLRIPLRLFLCFVHALLGKRMGRVLMREKILKEYQDADLIISINYGDGFSDIYGPLESFSVFSQNLLNNLSGKPVIFAPQSIGPFSLPFTKFLATILLNNAKLVMVREKITRKYLMEMGVSENLIHVIPDLAFLMPPVDEARVKEILRREGLNTRSRKPLFGMSVNPFIAQFAKMAERRDFYINLMSRFIDWIGETYDASIIFIPNVTQPYGFDTRTLGNLIKKESKRKEQIFSISGEYTAEELKGIIKRCDFFVGSLMHTVIASLSLSLPTIAIAYSHKAYGIMQLVGLGNYVIHFRDLHLESLISKTLLAWENKEEIRKRLIQKNREIKNALFSSGNMIKNLIEHGDVIA